MFLPDCLPDSSLASAHLTKKSWAPANSAALTLPWHSEEGLEFQPTEQLVQSIFTMLCSIERNIKLKYIHRDCVIFSYLSTKRRAFILVHTASLISFPTLFLFTLRIQSYFLAPLICSSTDLNNIKASRRIKYTNCTSLLATMIPFHIETFFNWIKIIVAAKLEFCKTQIAFFF